MSDGNIVAAKNKFGLAVDRLIKPQLGVCYDQARTGPSLYHQLLSDLAGTKGDTRAPAKSLPPLWIDAVQLLSDIDTEVRRWGPISLPAATPVPQRLERLSMRLWRPQDADAVMLKARTVDMWCEKILNLIRPESFKEISAPCPACETRWFYKMYAGEQVRTAALKLECNVGCVCQACGAFWEPTRYLFLCRLLGFDMPAGVLE